VASPTARVLAAMGAKVAPHMARALGGGADTFQFALQELGNNKIEEEESHDDDEESCGISMYHTWYRYWSTSNTLLPVVANIRVIVVVSLYYCTLFVHRCMHIFMLYKVYAE
jgi:hypothetical protein